MDKNEVILNKILAFISIYYIVCTEKQDIDAYK